MPLYYRILILITFCITMSNQLYSQLFQDVKLGIKSGINYNEIKGKSFQSTMNSNWHLGSYLQLKGKRLGLGLEAIYDESVYELRDMIFNSTMSEFTNDSVSNTLLTQHKYQFPLYLMFKLSFLQLQFGVIYEGLIGMKDSEKMFNDARTLFRSGTKNIMGGIWIDITPRWNIGGRYILNTQSVTMSNFPQKWHTREFQVHLGYSLVK